MEALSPHFQTIRPDLRGYGRSDNPDPQRPFRYADDLSALLDHLQVSKTHLVGLSLGGNVALDLALSHPQRVDKLVLVDSSLSGFPPFPGVAHSLQAIFIEAEQAGLEAARELWLQHPLFASGLEHPPVARQLRAIVQEYSGWHWANNYPPSRPIDLTLIERLEQVTSPTLVVVGERDTPQNQAIAGLLAQRIPGARKAVVPGSGHLVNLEAPLEFNRLLLDFLLSGPVLKTRPTV